MSTFWLVIIIAMVIVFVMGVVRFIYLMRKQNKNYYQTQPLVQQHEEVFKKNGIIEP